MKNFLWFLFSFGGMLVTGYMTIGFMALGEYSKSFLCAIGLVLVGVITFWSLRNEKN